MRCINSAQLTKSSRNIKSEALKIARNGVLEVEQATKSGIHSQKVKYSCLCCVRNLNFLIHGYVKRIISNSPFLVMVMYSWLCRVRNLHFLIPGYVFLTMSFEKSPTALSWLCRSWNLKYCISGYVVPGFVVCEYSWTDSWLCRVDNLKNVIPGYVVPEYVV
jgi:hypothetical protein